MEDTEVKVWEDIFLKVRRQSSLNSLWASSVGSFFRMLVVSTHFFVAYLSPSTYEQTL